MSSPDRVPRAVQVALGGAAREYLHTTRHETGRLLATLAAASSGPIAEIGTGSGVGAAWLISAARPGVRVVSVEQDPRRAQQAQQALAGFGIQVLEGGCEALRGLGPFALISLDRSTVSELGADCLVELMCPGGLVVIDDFTPVESWPPVTFDGLDEVRLRWAMDERFECTAVRVAPDSAVLLAAFRG